MPQTKKSTKKNSKLRRFLGNFNPSTKKGALLIYITAFAVFGGGYMAYRTFAASYPPQSMREWVRFSTVKAADGVSGPMDCISVAGKTGYGSLSQCIQFNSSYTKARPGLYSLDGRVFNQSGGWLTVPTYGVGATPYGIAGQKCSNMDNYFVGTATVTGYGTAQFGHVYRIGSYSSTGVKWQVKFATFNVKNKTCGVSATWMNAVSWDNIQTN